MRNKIPVIIIFLSVVVSSFSFAQSLDRSKQLKEEGSKIGVSLEIGTYYQEVQKREAEQEVSVPETTGPGIADWLGKTVLLPFDNYVRIPAWNFLKSSGLAAKNWISSKTEGGVPEKVTSSEEAEEWAVTKPIILMFSGIKNWLSDLKKKGYLPLTKERKLRSERVEKISEFRQYPGFNLPELPVALPSKQSADYLVNALSTPVPLKCRANIFELCTSCPSVSDPYKYFELSVVPESCLKCVAGNDERLKICIINAKFPVVKPEPDEKPVNGTGGVILE